MSVLATGSVLGDFRIEDEIGHGGMGVVYRALQVSLGRTVALKVIAERFAEHDAFRDRFVRESQLAASVDHPNVLPVYAAGEEDGVLYIAMRFVAGTDLRTLLANEGRLSAWRAANIVAQVAWALDAAHERGLVHRDVKPANVLVAGAGSGDHVYLTDFGLTKRSASSSGFTASGEWVGTIDYIAPEQLRGDKVDGRADTYALGCVLYETLTGHVPFPREDDVAKLWAHMSEPAPSALTFAPETPEALADVARRAMEKEPRARFARAADLGRAALGAAGGGFSVQGELETRVIDRPTKLSAHRSTLRGPAPRRGRGWLRWALLAAGLAAAAGIAAALALTLSTDGDDEAGEPRRALPPAPPAVVSGEIVGTPLQVGGRPSSLGAGSEFVRIVDRARGTLISVGQTTNRVLGDPVPLGGHPNAMTLAPTAAWVSATDTNEVLRVEPDERIVTDRIPVGRRPTGLGLAPGALWVVNQGSNTISRIDTAARAVEGPPVRVGRRPVNAVYAGGSVWVTNSADDTVSRIDSLGHRTIATVPVGDRPEGITLGNDAVWVANRADDTVSRIDPATNRVAATIPVGDSPRNLKSGPSGVWVPNAGDGTLSLIDHATNRTLGAPLRVGRGVARVAVGFDVVWALSPTTARLTRIDPASR
jgi:YVTN family beta-propeller protein